MRIGIGERICDYVLKTRSIITSLQHRHDARPWLPDEQIPTRPDRSHHLCLASYTHVVRRATSWLREATVRQAILSLTVVAAVGHVSMSVSTQGYRWWQDDAIRHELELTVSQVDTLEALFVSTLADRRALRRELDRNDEYVERLLARGDVDDTVALEAITRLEATRARRNAARTIMLFRMYRILSAEQRRKLKRLTEPQTEPPPQ